MKILFLVHNDPISIRRFLLLSRALEANRGEAFFLGVVDDSERVVNQAAEALGMRSAPFFRWFRDFRRITDVWPKIRFRVIQFFRRKRHPAYFDEKGRFCLSSILPELHGRVFSRFQTDLKAARRAINKLKPDLIVYDTELFSVFLSVLFAAKEKEIASVSMQHAEGWTDQYSGLPLLANSYIAYSEYNRQVLLKMGARESDIYVCGAPETDLIFHLDRDSVTSELQNKYKIDSSQRLLLIPLRPNTAETLVAKNIQLLDAVRQVSSQWKDIAVLVKEHPTDFKSGKSILNHYNFEKLPNFFLISPEYPAAKLLKVCHWLLTYKSAVVSEAALLGIPTLLIDENQKAVWPNWEKFEIFKTIQMDQLENTLLEIFEGKNIAPSPDQRSRFISFFRYKFDDQSVARTLAAFDEISHGRKGAACISP